MNKIDIESWKGFKIPKLFEIKPPATRSIKKYNEGEVPYVSSGGINNGIVSYLEPKDGEQLEKGNCITVSPLEGTPAFYQEKDFLGRGGAGSAISILYNENLTKYNALFICTVIKIAAQKFKYSDALKGDNLNNLSINLPVMHNGDGTIFIDKTKRYSDDGYVPNWVYMDKYMRKIEKQHKKD